MSAYHQGAVDLSNVPDLPQAGLQAALLYKICGPPAAAFGQRLKESVEDFRLRNLGEIFHKADAKMSRDDIEGRVPLRIVAAAWDQGSYVDDAVSADYWGGVIASSRTPEGTDDRGIAWTSLIARLPSAELRVHYLLYSAFRSVLQELPLDERPKDIIDSEQTKTVLRIYVPFTSFIDPLGASSYHEAWDVTARAFRTLDRERLIRSYHYGALDFIRETFPDATEPGGIVTASHPGIELFLWAHGLGGLGRPTMFGSTRIPLEPTEDMGRLEGVLRVKETAKERRARLEAETGPTGSSSDQT